MNDLQAEPPSSTVTVGELQPEDRLWHCRDWLDPSCEFEEVAVIERRYSRVLVGPVSGGASAARSVYAKTLWRSDQLERAAEWRRRDIAIARLDRERRLDGVTVDAIDLCALLASGDICRCDQGDALALLRRLGRPDNLQSLHELAYVADHGPAAAVNAPGQAWRELYAAFAAAEPRLVDERVVELSESLMPRSAERRNAAIAMVRRWAGLPALLPPGPPANGHAEEPSEVQRLRAIVELAAEALDEAGRADQAFRIRRAAFPHRFAPQS